MRTTLRCIAALAALALGTSGGAALAAGVGSGVHAQAPLQAPPGLLKLRPETVDQSCMQAVRLVGQGRYKEALATLHEAAGLFAPHTDVLTYIGYASRKQGLLAPATSLYRDALVVAPGRQLTDDLSGDAAGAGGVDRTMAQLAPGAPARPAWISGSWRSPIRPAELGEVSPPRTPGAAWRWSRRPAPRPCSWRPRATGCPRGRRQGPSR